MAARRRVTTDFRRSQHALRDIVQALEHLSTTLAQTFAQDIAVGEMCVALALAAARRPAHVGAGEFVVYALQDFVRVAPDATNTVCRFSSRR